MLQEQESSEVYSGFRMVMASVAFYLVAIACLILSKVLLHQVHRRHPITNGQLMLWVGGEVVMESFIYTVFTELFVITDPNMFLSILGRAILVLAFILIVPYVICVLYATTRYRRLLLDRIGMNMVNDKTDKTDPKLIHLVDSTGKLKMSISIDSLYYVESQDNYVKIYYENHRGHRLCADRAGGHWRYSDRGAGRAEPRYQQSKYHFSAQSGGHTPDRGHEFHGLRGHCESPFLQ